MKHILLALTAVAIAGCASDSSTPKPRLPTDAEVEQYNAQAPREQQIVCRMETRLGSRFARRACYRVGYLEDLNDQGQDVVDLMQIDGLLDSPLHYQF
jgi:hypothetical protein